MSIFEEMGFPAIKSKDALLSEQVAYNIAMAYTLLAKKIAKEYKEFSLTPAKINVLMILRHIGKEEGLQQNDISAKLIVTGSNTTGLIDRLESEGLVERFKVKDRRVNKVRITKKGIDLVEKVWPLHLKRTEEAVGSLTKSEMLSLVELLTKLRKGLQTK